MSDLALARSTLFCAFPSTEKAEFEDGENTLSSMKMPYFMDGNAKQLGFVGMMQKMAIEHSVNVSTADF